MIGMLMGQHYKHATANDWIVGSPGHALLKKLN